MACCELCRQVLGAQCVEDRDQELALACDAVELRIDLADAAIG